MSTIVTDTLQGKTSATSITLPTTTNIGSTPLVSASANSMTIRGEGSAVTNIQQGLCKAWSGIDAHTSVSQFDSFNIASITDTSAGLQSHNLTNAFSQSNYCCTAGTNGSGIENFGAVEVQNGVTVTASLMATRTYKTATNALADFNSVFVIGHGDLA